ncbi:hypothetical protein [Streptomyces sp. NBC_01304]|uniref:hypothetical protein n=1 Tax=Streptomyces sp. NBC_01304 TaxID=2903818 RepID=UPI002E127604|nr:hypothetical protein OG430_26795 [Streptomyces sp. NBC_01304]
MFELLAAAAGLLTGLLWPVRVRRTPPHRQPAPPPPTYDGDPQHPVDVWPFEPHDGIVRPYALTHRERAERAERRGMPVGVTR